MAPDSDNEGDDRNGAVSFPPRARQRFTTSTETLTPPSLPPAGDSLHAPPLPPLPFDILVEILCRLPVKPLLQFRCVCKSWNSLISDPKFAKKHLHCSPPDFTRHHLMTSDMDDSRKYRLKAYPLLSVSDAVPATATQLEYPLIYERDQILGSCNGIVCVANRQGGFAVFWNPSTRRFKKSPPLENPRLGASYAVYGFGYDHFADSYNVVAVFWYEYKIRVKVHTLGTNCWRMIQDFPSLCVPQSAVFVSGKLNWLALASESVANLQRARRVIISQDLGKECYQELLLPGDYEDDGGKQAMNLQVLKDCLCVYILSPRRRICDIWLMMEYGRKESWTKLFTVPDPKRCFSGTKILHISKEDEGLVVKVHGILYLYNFRDNTFKILPIRNIEDWTVPVVYVESLISPCF